VTDDGGNPVPGLRQESFSVLESADGAELGRGGRSRPSSRTRAGPGESPFLLLIDNSGSMYDTVAGTRTADAALTRITASREAVQTFLASMTNPADQVGLVDFNTFYHVLSRPDRGARTHRRPPGRHRPACARPGVHGAVHQPRQRLARVRGYRRPQGDHRAVRWRELPLRRALGEEPPGNRFPHHCLHRRDPRLPAGGGSPCTASASGPRRTGTSRRLPWRPAGGCSTPADARELSSAYETIRRQVAGEYLLTYRAGLAPAERTHVRVEVDAGGARAAATRFYFASTVLAFRLTRLTPLLLVPLAVAVLLLVVLTLLKLERRPGPASLEVLQTMVGRPSTRVLPLAGAKTVIGATRAADLTISGAPQVQDKHATVLYDPREKRYTVVGAGDILGEQPARAHEEARARRRDRRRRRHHRLRPAEGEKGTAAKRTPKKG